MWIYIAIFFLIAFLAVEFELKPFNKSVLWIVAVPLLGLLAGLRGENVAKDYVTYQRIFDFYQELQVQEGFLPNFEPGFSLIVLGIKAISQLNYGILIMLTFSVVSIFIRVSAFYKLAVNPFLVLLFYYSHYFFLHEMSQIRIALASAIFMFSLTYYLRGNKKAYFFLILIASSFHYSAIFYLALFFVDNRYFKKYFTILTLSAAILFGIFKLPIVSILPNQLLVNILPKVTHYTTAVEYGVADAINVFNIYNLFSIVTCAYLVILIPREELIKNSQFVVSLRFVVLSILLLSLLSGVPTMSYRFSELFGIMDVFVFASLAIYLPFRKWNILVTVGIAFLLFSLTIFHGDLVNPYSQMPFK